MVSVVCVRGAASALVPVLVALHARFGSVIGVGVGLLWVVVVTGLSVLTRVWVVNQAMAHHLG